jgi:hypothetical protein
MFDPSTATWYLRNELSAGAPDAGVFQYGLPGWIPVVGDWNGDGKTTIGVVDPTTETWYLRNENSAGAPDFPSFQYGAPGWKPVVGDWNGDGTTTIGVQDPAANWYLRNANNAGAPDIPVFAYGLGSWIPQSGFFPPASQLERAANGPRLGSPVGTVLSQATLTSVVDQALHLLSSAGVDPLVINQLASAHYLMGALPGADLGLTNPLTQTVQISSNAAGYGWYVDTSAGNSAFNKGGPGGSLTAQPRGPAAGKMDLLTVVLHEMGHLTGQSDLSSATNPNDLMADTLAPGIRRVDALDQVFSQGGLS